MQNNLPAVEPLIEALAQRCAGLIQDQQPIVVGIRTGGLWIARELMARLQLPGEPGEIDIGFHRDDFNRRGLPQQIRPTRVEATENRFILLVDDVLHSGRTARAAINALFEFGRPRAIRLAVLVARSGRDLPICADAVGASLDLPPGMRVKLRGPENLALELEGDADE